MTTPKQNLAQRMTEANDQLKSELKDLNEDLNTTTSQLAAYQKLGTVEQIEEAFGKLHTQAEALEQMSILSTSINESFGGSEGADPKEVIKSISEELTVLRSEREQLLEFNEEYGGLGEASQAIDSAIDNSVKFQEVCESLSATPEELTKLAKEYGTVPEIINSVDKSTKVLTQISEARDNEKLREIAESYGKTIDQAQSIMSKFNLSGADQLEEFYESAGVPKVEKEGEEDLSESFNPGSSFTKIVDGRAFARHPEGGSNFERQGINESNNSPERAARLL